MLELRDRHVVIAGAAGALGRVVAARAKDFGAKAVLVDRVTPDDGPEDWIQVDLTDRAGTIAALSDIGPVDALFHVAGGFSMGVPVHETDNDVLADMQSLNVATLQNVLAAIVPGMLRRKTGAIVTVGALGALKGGALVGAYAAAKSAVMRLTESLSAELRDHGINANCVLPSIIDTPANRRDMPDADFSRWVTPRELADVICFLGSPMASGLHGALVPVAGRV